METRSALFFLALGLALLLVVLPAGIQVGPVAPGQLGPAFFPRLLAIAITATACLLLLRLFLRRETVPPPATEPGDGSLAPGRARLLTALTLVLHVPAIQLLGFVAASALAVVATMLLFGERRWWVILAVALPVPGLLWLFATRVLHVTMP